MRVTDTESVVFGRAMKPLIVLLALVSLTLGYEYSNHSRFTQKIIRTMKSHDGGYVTEKRLSKLEDGVTQGNPFAAEELGRIFTFGVAAVPERGQVAVARDTAKGRELTLSAASNGATFGLFSLWRSTDELDDDLLLRALELGDPMTVGYLLLRKSHDMDCSPEGQQALFGHLPSRELVLRNRRGFRDAISTWGDPWAGNSGGMSPMMEKAYTDVLMMLETDLAEVLCGQSAQGATPEASRKRR